MYFSIKTQIRFYPLTNTFFDPLENQEIIYSCLREVIQSCYF